MRHSVIRVVAALALAGTAVIAGGPSASAAPTVTLSENSGLAAGETVTVTLTGLPPNMASVAVGQCKPAVTMPTDCNLTGALLGRADDQGIWQPNTGSRVLTLVASVGGTDCAAAPGACTVAVTSLTAPTNILASIPLTFGAKQTPATATTTAAAPSSDTDDSNTGVVIGIAAAVAVVLVAAVAVIAVRRRSPR